MAQVRKLQSGGTTKPKRGNITLNGKVIASGDQITDEYLNNLVVGTGFEGVKNLLDEGGTWAIDDVNGYVETNYVPDLGNTRKANRRERKLGRATSEFAHRDVRNIKAGLEVVRQRIQPPKEQEKESKTHDLSKDIFLTIGEDGKILKDTDYSNAKERVNFLKNINNLGIDFDNDILNYGQRSHTWDSIKKNSLLTNWNDDPDSWDESGKAMGEDYGIFIKKKDDPKKVDANDLNKDGIIDDDEKKISTENPKYSAAGLDYDKHSPYIVFDDNGDMVLTNKFDTDFGVGNVAFNDFWRKSKSWNPDLDWLYGYSRYGNKLYKTSDIENKNSTLYKLLSNAGFFNMNLNDNYSEANNVFNYLWDSSDEWNRFNPETSYWDPGEEMSTKDILYRPLTGVYKKEVEDDNYQILEYYYGNSDRDEWGRPVKYYYGLFNNDGKFIDNIDRDELTRIDRGEQKAFSGIKNRIYDLSNNIYHGRIKNEYQGKDGSYVRTYSMPGEDIIIEMSDFDKYNHLGNNKKAFRLTPELSRIIEANPGFWDNLLKSVNREHFIASLRSMIDRNYIPGATYDLGLLPEDKRKYIAKEFGIKDDDIDSFLNELNSDINYLSNISKQKMKYLVPLYNPIQKQQKGGLLGKTLADKEYEPVIVDNTRNVNASTSSDAGLSWDNLTSADKLQLTSIGADLGSLLGGPWGAALGLTGTGMQFAADIKRDGFDAGDLKELGLGLGLDVISLLPGLGAAKVFKGITKMAPLIKTIFIGLGAKDGLEGLSNIMSGDYSVEDFRKVANGLMAFKSAGMKKGEISASKEKTLPKKQNIIPKSIEDFRKEAIDEFIKKHPEYTKVDGTDVEWYDRSTGKITDYNKADEGLKNVSEYKPNEKIEKLKAAYDKMAANTKNVSSNVSRSRYNPFGDNFKYKSSRRTLGSTRDEIRESYKVNPNAVSRLANIDDDIADELASAGFRVEQTWFGRAIITDTKSYKKGGIINKYSPGGFIEKVTTKKFEIPDFTKQAIDLSRHINAYTQRKKEAELTKKMYDKARYNNELVNYDKISSVAGISPIIQRENAENQILKSTYSNIAKTTDFGKQLSIANTIADKQLANSRLRNIDLGTQLNKNELTLIGQNNEEKAKNVELINNDRSRLASIESGKIQADIGLTSGNASQFEAGATQFLSDLNKHKLLTSKSNAINDEYEANKWYSDEYNKIISERLAAIKDSGLSQEQFYLSPQAKQYSDRLNNLLNLYKSKLKSIEINNTFDPYTGKYLSSNLPQYVKKGGRVRSDKEFNNDRILKNIELDNKRIIQLNENILKLLMKALG